MLDQKIDINSGDWKQQIDCMYRSRQKKIWYCNKCYEIIKSPKTANTHAGYHCLTLPCSRKKSVSPKNQLVKEELSERARKSIEEFEQTISSSTRKEKEMPKRQTDNEAFEERMRSYFSRENRTNNQNSSTNFVPLTPLGREIEKRLRGKLDVETMKRTSCFSDEEIKEKEIEFGLREEPPKNEGMKNAAIAILLQRYRDEDHPAGKRLISMTMELVKQEEDPQKITMLLLSTLPKPQPKRDESVGKFVEKMFEKFVEREEKRPDLFESADKFLDLMNTLRKKPSHDKGPNENSTPPGPSDDGLDPNVKP